MKISHTNKKIISAIILGAIIVAPVRSFAIWGVGDETQDPALIGISTNTGVQATLQTIDQYFGYLKTFGLDGLAYALAQRASQKLVSSVLNSVNGGASGNKPPNYVANYASYFASLGGKTTTNYYNSLQYSKNPFAAGIAQGIANTNSGFAPSGLNAFNLNTILTNGTSWQSSATNLSSAGIQGFDFYSALAFPQNTPLGSNMIAQQQLGQNQASAQNLAKIQLTSTGYKPQTLENTGQGIFSSIGSQYGVNTNALISASKAKVTANQQASATNAEHGQNNGTTVKYADGSYILNGTYYNSVGGTIGSVTNTGNIYDDNMVLVGNSSGGPDGLPSGVADYNVAQNGGASIGNPTDATNQRSSGDIGGTTTITDSCSSDCVSFSADGTSTIDGAPVDNTNLTGDQSLTLGAAPSLTEDYSAASDVGANITTPAATTADTTNNATKEATVRLQNSDQFFKLIFSTLTQLVTGLIDKGISSLRTDAGHSSPYQYGSPASVATGYNGASGSWASGPQTIIDFQTDLGVANQKTALDVQYNTNILNLLKVPVTGTVLNSAQITAGVPQSQGTTDVLQKLETCIPGPDTGWDTRLQTYTDSQMRATQIRGNGSDGNAPRNQQVYALIQRQVKTAVQEEKERIMNPFLNIPAATEMSTIASDFYSNSQKFQGIFTTLLLKRQVSSQLLTILAQVKAFIPTLVLFDDQWQKLTQTQQDALYAQLSPQILADSSAGYFTNTYTTTDATGNTVLTPLPPIHPTVIATVGTGMGMKGVQKTMLDMSVDNTVARNTAEETRVLDEEWHVWETDTTHITEAQRQTLYQQFESVKTNITDAKSLQATQTMMNSVAQQNTDLADALHDCLLIRDATKNYKQYTTQADWDAFKNTLYSSSIKAAFLPNTSIIAVANGTSGIDFSKESDITLPLDKNNDLPTSGGDLDMLSAWVTSSLPLPPGASNPYHNTGIRSLINTVTLGVDSSLFGSLLGGHTQDNKAVDTYYLRWVDKNNINQLQVQPVIPLTQDPVINGLGTPDANLGSFIGTPDVITGLFDEDAASALFCRLQAYTLNYWIPNGMTGQPIGCFKAKIEDFQSDGTSQNTGSTNPSWYHVNRAEIYYNLSNPTGTQ